MYYDSNVVTNPDINEIYKEACGAKLPVSVYLPENFDKEKKYPTAIVIHGGGWHAVGTKSPEWTGGVMNHNAIYYQKRGFVGITISYRGIKITPETSAKDLICDCNDALKFIKENYSFVDTDNVIFLGDSAGGHLVLSLCMELALTSPLQIMPKAVIACNPVTDCVCEKWSYSAHSDEARIEVSPMDNIKKVDTKLFVLHGMLDGCVNIDDSRRFFKKMKDAGNDIRMEEIPDAKHAFIVFKYLASDEKVSAVHEIIDKFLTEEVAFR